MKSLITLLYKCDIEIELLVSIAALGWHREATLAYRAFLQTVQSTNLAVTIQYKKSRMHWDQEIYVPLV